MHFLCAQLKNQICDPTDTGFKTLGAQSSRTQPYSGKVLKLPEERVSGPQEIQGILS